MKKFTKLRCAIEFNILSYMTHQLLSVGNCVAALDELYLFLDSPVTTPYIRNNMKRVRKKEANLTASDVELLQNVETTMMEIENAMIEAELSADVGAAQALYIMALYDFASQPGFVSRLVSCFEAEQTEAQVIANVNAAFGTEIPVQEFTDVMRNVRSRRIDTARYVDYGTKNNLDLVQWAISACNSGWGYVMGTFGQVLTVDLLEAKLAQLPDAIGPYEDYIRANYLGVRTADCIGLIKGYSWYDPETGNINYKSNGMPDVGADQIYNQAAERGSMAGYLYAQHSQDYFPRVITSTLKGIMADSTNKISRILFKLAVEQAITMNVVAATCNISREQLEKLRGTCVAQVKRSNGVYSFEDAFDFQKR